MTVGHGRDEPIECPRRLLDASGDRLEVRDGPVPAAGEGLGALALPELLGGHRSQPGDGAADLVGVGLKDPDQFGQPAGLARHRVVVGQGIPVAHRAAPPSTGAGPEKELASLVSVELYRLAAAWAMALRSASSSMRRWRE